MQTENLITLTESQDAKREEARFEALRDLDLLDTPESESFDRITRMASQFFAAPIAAVSLTDRTRQWFKSHVGTSGRQIPREGAPCAEVTRSTQSLVDSDLLEDARFADGVLAQAGVSSVKAFCALTTVIFPYGPLFKGGF